jgi:hypothetical protein
MILSAKLQRNTSLAITSGSKSFELRVQLYGSPPHGKSSIKISTIVCKYDIDISNFIHSKETSFGSRWRMPQPRAEAVFKKGDTVTATSVHIQLIPRDQLMEPITAVATCSSIRLQVPPVPKP